MDAFNSILATIKSMNLRLSYGNYPNCITFLCTSNGQVEFEIENMHHLHYPMHPKMKYLSLNLTKHLQDLCEEKNNYWIKSKRTEYWSHDLNSSPRAGED